MSSKNKSMKDLKKLRQNIEKEASGQDWKEIDKWLDERECLEK